MTDFSGFESLCKPDKIYNKIQKISNTPAAAWCLFLYEFSAYQDFSCAGFSEAVQVIGPKTFACFSAYCIFIPSRLRAARRRSSRLRLRHPERLTRPFFFCSCVRPRWEIQQLMNVELVPSVSSDYLDLNLSSNKHSASRLGRHKPPFAASRLHQAVNWFIFSGRWNSSFSGRRRQWVQGEPGEEGGLEGGGRWGEVTFDDITF